MEVFRDGPTAASPSPAVDPTERGLPPSASDSQDSPLSAPLDVRLVVVAVIFVVLVVWGLGLFLLSSAEPKKTLVSNETVSARSPARAEWAPLLEAAGWKRDVASNSEEVWKNGASQVSIRVVRGDTEGQRAENSRSFVFEGVTLAVRPVGDTKMDMALVVIGILASGGGPRSAP